MRTIKPVDEMAEMIAIDRDNRANKLYNTSGNSNYKIAADNHRQEVISAEVAGHRTQLAETFERVKVDLNNATDVKRRILDYFDACSVAGAFPSLMGLCSHGFGVSRIRVHNFMKDHPTHESTELINLAKETMADLLTNAALENVANPVMAIFQLKNHFEHADRTEIAPIVPTNTDEYHEEDIRARYVEEG